MLWMAFVKDATVQLVASFQVPDEMTATEVVVLTNEQKDAVFQGFKYDGERFTPAENYIDPATVEFQKNFVPEVAPEDT